MIKILFCQKFEVFFGFVYLFICYLYSECVRLICLIAEFSVIGIIKELFVR